MFDYKKLIKNRETRLKIGSLLKYVPSALLLHVEYKIKTGKKLNIKNPKRFNEKLQWLKLYNCKSEYTQMVDKVAVREVIKNKIGEEYLVPLLGVWESYDEIDFDVLPDQFVLKCSHDSGSVRIIRDKKQINHKELKKFYDFRLNSSPYDIAREWPYKNAERRIIAEEMLSDDRFVINVYKVFNFNGNPKIIQAIMNDKQTDETVDYYDLDWNRLDISQAYPNSETGVERPQKLSEMIELSRKLSEGLPFIRTDFYEIGNRIYFSEYTFFSDSGYSPFVPDRWDYIMGEWLDISTI